MDQAARKRFGMQESAHGERCIFHEWDEKHPAVLMEASRESPAELLGANLTHDVSLLRLLEPDPYPHVPIRANSPVEVGDWVLKIGHPLGYRKGRSAPVRLGRVIYGTAEIFGTDCMVCGGDSGGPYVTTFLLAANVDHFAGCASGNFQVPFKISVRGR